MTRKAGIWILSVFLLAQPLPVLAREQAGGADSEAIISRELEENYTSTELHQATIALRANVFTGFEGEIHVTLKEKNGIIKQYVLNPENFYEHNAMVNSGTYRIRDVEAYDGRYLYQTSYAQGDYPLSEQGILLLEIEVGEEQIGEVAHGELDTGGKEPVEEAKEAGTEKEREPMANMQGRGHVWAAGIAGICAGLLYYTTMRKKRSRYD